MSWTGYGHPVLIIAGTATNFPYCLSGGREEKWTEELGEGWTTLSGEWIPGDTAWRWSATYKWGSLTDDQVETLLRLRNEGTVVTVRPRHDSSTWQVECRISDIKTEAPAVALNQDTLEVTFTSIERFPSVIIPDLRVFCYTDKGVVYGM